MQVLRVAVIGCGRIAAQYQGVFEQIGPKEIKLVLAFDKVSERAVTFASAFPGCIASSQTEPTAVACLLQKEQVDIVHILLPHHLHCAYTVAALTAGIHVLTEKPIGISLEQADEMILAQQASGKQLGVIFQNRYIDGVQMVRQMIASGELGSVKGAFSTMNWYRPASYYACDWKGRWATEGGGVVIDQAIHSIDLVRYMTGLDAVKIQGHTARRVLKNIEVEDEADAAITLENGAIYSFFACNYYTSNSPIRVEICCENGTALLTYDRMEIRWNNGQIQVIEPTSAGSTVPGVVYWGAFHEKQILQCYEALRTGKPMPWSAQDARKTLEIVLGIYESSRIQDEVLL